VCPDEDREQRASAVFARNDLTPPERAAFYLHEITGCDGLEFVAFSNARLRKTITLANGVILVPCFLDKTEGQDPRQPLVQLTMKMEYQSRFVYDGWVPIQTWNDESVRKAVRGIDEALSVLCLCGRTFFEWQPKYPAPDESVSAYWFEDRHLHEMEEAAKRLDRLHESDRIALYRSLAWLFQSRRLEDPAARFLFSVLAIEALATYIEEEAPDESALAVLRADRLTKTQKRKEREICINKTLGQLLAADPTEAVKTAYFSCVVGIKRRLYTHLKRVFADDPEPTALLFEEEVDGKSLYELRHEIAHGRADVLSALQRQRIQERIWDAERIARRYILIVLEKALGVPPFSKGIKASQFIGVSCVSHEGMYQGPTHMAVLYS
jgi:hypothetical protein